MRLHELAKELGMMNQEVVDLCGVLGVPVKSHSSSLNEAYADMVRRRAVRDGLTREEQPEEPKPEKAPAKKAAAKKKSRRQGRKAAESGATPPAQAETAPTTAPSTPETTAPGPAAAVEHRF